MKSKERILSQWDWSNKVEVLAAMDEYAKEFTASFCEWAEGYSAESIKPTVDRFINTLVEQ